MFDLSNNHLQDMRAFMSLHYEALQNAAVLLGGQPALRRTQVLLDEFMSAPRLTRRITRELVALHDLLTLRNVHDLERIEAGCFAEIDPASPIVEDLCLLTEALKDQLHRLNEEHPFHDFDLLHAA